MNRFPDQLVAVLRDGGVAVIRTDTLYGLVGRADNQATVERIYALKHRDTRKSLIVLISDPDGTFDDYNATTMETLAAHWPGPTSIILPSASGPSWLTRGNQSIAYRLPNDVALRELLRATGPLVAPSANPEGQPPAMTITEAKAYFGGGVDYYHDGGTVISPQPSSLLRYTTSRLTRLR